MADDPVDPTALVQENVRLRRHLEEVESRMACLRKTASDAIAERSRSEGELWKALQRVSALEAEKVELEADVVRIATELERVRVVTGVDSEVALADVSNVLQGGPPHA